MRVRCCVAVGSLLALFLSGTANADGASDLATAFFQQIASCWNPPAPPAAASVVTLHVELAADGNLAAPPVAEPATEAADPEAIKRAVAAVHTCAPYKLPAALYEKWRDVTIRFDPRSMYSQ